MKESERKENIINLNLMKFGMKPKPTHHSAFLSLFKKEMKEEEEGMKLEDTHFINIFFFIQEVPLTYALYFLLLLLPLLLAFKLVSFIIFVYKKRFFFLQKRLKEEKKKKSG